MHSPPKVLNLLKNPADSSNSLWSRCKNSSIKCRSSGYLHLPGQDDARRDGHVQKTYELATAIHTTLVHTEITTVVEKHTANPSTIPVNRPSFSAGNKIFYSKSDGSLNGKTLDSWLQSLEAHFKNIPNMIGPQKIFDVEVHMEEDAPDW